MIDTSRSDKFGHIMLDIETMGTEPGSSIIAIGAVEFNLNTGEIGEGFYRHVSLKSCDMVGLKCDASTVLFWMEQSDDARSKFIGNGVNGISINQSLIDFTKFVTACGKDRVQVWGNGARFDMGLMNEAYRKCTLPVPWDFRKERDVRTLVSFAPDVMKSVPFEGVRHDAYADCMHQIKYCVATYDRIRPR